MSALLKVSDLGPCCCENQDNNDQENTETKNDPDTEANNSSDQSCYVCHVTTASVHADEVYLHQGFTTSYGLGSKCRKIALTDEGERSWELDPICRDSTSPNQNRLVTLTLTHDNLKSSRLYLPLPFLRENGITKPGMVTLLGKDGTRGLANLLQERSGRMSLGKGFKTFSRANGLKVGESFTLELIWENATPVLSLVCNESRNKNRFVTLRLTHDSLKKCRLGLPLPFMRENGMTNPGTITLLGKDGTKWMASLLRESTGRMSLGKGWKDFAIGNGIETGESFTLEAIWKEETPMLSLSNTESKSDGMCEGGDCSKAGEKESVSI